jgi:hypothetical protein
VDSIDGFDDSCQGAMVYIDGESRGFIRDNTSAKDSDISRVMLNLGRPYDVFVHPDYLDIKFVVERISLYQWFWPDLYKLPDPKNLPWGNNVVWEINNNT